MRKAIGLGAVVALMAVLPASAMAGGRPFVLSMTGAEEAPGPGDPDGSGTAWLSLNSGLGEVCFALSVEDIALPATGAHIHRAAAGSPGPVVVPLIAPDASGQSSGCVSADAALVKEIRKTPSGFYVNVHSTEFPAGAVRAQLDQ